MERVWLWKQWHMQKHVGYSEKPVVDDDGVGEKKVQKQNLLFSIIFTCGIRAREEDKEGAATRAWCWI